MDNKGYIENGFIIDLTTAKKISEIIYELSCTLNMQEAKEKQICLKLGSLDITEADMMSIKALIEVMNSNLSFISTTSEKTLEVATNLGIEVSEFTNEVEAPNFGQPEQNEEVSEALDNIFGEENTTPTITEHLADNEIVEVIQNDNSITQVTVEQGDSEEVIAKKKEAEKLPTLYLRKTVRSGQSISSDGNIIVIGDVNPGAEIIAKGDITVWGILGGIAHAGSCGNEFARIRALKLNPVQIRIGEIFARRPDSANIPYIQKSSEYIPEEAYAYKGSIVIKKFHEEN